MTTPHGQPEGASPAGSVETSTEAPASATEATGSPTGATESAPEAAAAQPEAAQRSAEVPDSAGEARPASAEGSQPPAQNADTSGGRALFAEDELSVLRLRWDEVQSGFVDDPRECVQKADGLVSDVVDRITTGFSEARSRLEEQWARGEEGSTEDLRLALKRYREFFQRLLEL
ncbi:hypothetical protein Rhow_005417 [Rhodococcus wratislaviensis]|uniref:Uncharacterized protein n=1 Tax=Rhodococcus wratislaviensis TaxID=44752 RepID=A0A402CDU3_RHOWR|nr:hypothetical protein [Rhodococcus wratislaviensis]GCE41758.1 hypothetical protein Rhow_005417 [Rhodococcus wratislaviensis]